MSLNPRFSSRGRTEQKRISPGRGRCGQPVALRRATVIPSRWGASDRLVRIARRGGEGVLDEPAWQVVRPKKMRKQKRTSAKKNDGLEKPLNECLVDGMVTMSSTSRQHEKSARARKKGTRGSAKFVYHLPRGQKSRGMRHSRAVNEYSHQIRLLREFLVSER